MSGLIRAPVLSPRARWWLLAAALLILVVVSSGGGLRNGFTYDDVYIIQLNGIVHSLHEWWRLFTYSYWPRLYGSDGYRPLTMLAFAIQWVTGGGAPWVFHATNIALYGAITIAVFRLASALLPPAAAWFAAALFAVHPVHVEAVANIVGQSELSVALLLIIAVGLYVRGRLTSDGGRLTVRAGIVICACYAAALFAKEHAIVLPALLVAAEIMVIDDARPMRRRLVTMRPLLLWLVLVAVLYIGARDIVKGGNISGFQPFVVFQALDLSYANRVLTMIGVVPSWVRLLLWPAHLSTEYAPPYIDVAQGPSVLQLPGLLLLIGILGLGVALWRHRGLGRVASFGIAWLCVTLLPTSNFVVPAGIILSERTLFLPSVGALLAVGALVARLQGELVRARQFGHARIVRIVVGTASGAILIGGCWRSLTRTSVWHDNERLFSQAVADAPLSYRASYILGAWLFMTGRKAEGEHYYRHALKLFPYDPFMAYNLALQYQTSHMYKAAIPLYRWAFEIAPYFREGEGRANLAVCLLEAGEPAAAREQALIGMRRGGASLKDLRRIVQLADSLSGRGAYRSSRTKHPTERAKRMGRKVPAKSQIAEFPKRGADHARVVTRSSAQR
jgi:hypothetical protein